MTRAAREGARAAPAGAPDAARKRAAVETYVRHEAALRRTASRYSICADDADDALQRALEILLRKAPSEDPRELVRWTQTVVKHEALAVRRERERILAGPAARVPEPGREDWVALIPADADGPPERAERREAVARGREALSALKPQELRALTLLAEGYSYREIGEITGFSQTKVNRCVAEGRERFRDLVARGEDGRRCRELGSLLSAFCDGEAAADEAARVREHLRACPQCRATLRAYRAAPAAVAAMAPALPLHRTLVERVQETVTGLSARFSGGGGASDSALSQVAASGGTRGVGLAALAKVTALCVGTFGGAAACVATGVVPAPLMAAEEPVREQRAQRESEPAEESAEAPVVEAEPEPAPETVAPEPEPEPEPEPDPEPEPVAPEPAPEPPASASGAVEYTAPPPPPPAPPPAAGPGTGSAAGEFGP